MDTAEELRIYREVRNWLSDPSHWTRGWFANNSDGLMINGWDDGVEETCLLGAFQKVTGTDSNDELFEPLVKCIGDSGRFTASAIIQFNDSDASHEDVLRVLDCAINALESGPA